MSTFRYPEHFRRNMAWVALAHVLLLLFLFLWALMKPAPPKPIKFINMLNKGDLVKGRPGPTEGPVVGKTVQPAEAAPPAPPPARSTPPAPQPEAVKPAPAPQPVVAPKPVPTPPAPTPNSWATKKSKPDKATKPTPKPTPPAPPKAKHQVKVNLDTEVERSASDSPSPKTSKSTSNAKVSGDDPAGRGHAREGVHGMTPDGIAEKLGRELQMSGVANAVKIGPSGSPNGTGGENGWYYTLIRDQMYQAWDMPTSLAGKKLQTLIRIFVEKNGTITKVDLVRSSGNQEHDDSALSAVRRVRRIREPLPEGMDGNIDINFRLTE